MDNSLCDVRIETEEYVVGLRHERQGRNGQDANP
jgi:hypothetical protein